MLPADRTSVVAVILMCGAAGAGKTTYARRLESQGWLRLSVDVETWRRGITTLPAPRDLLEEIEDDLVGELVDAVGAGRDVVLDFSFATRALRDDYRELIADLGTVAETVYLPVDTETALRRVRARGGEGPDDYRLTDEVVRAHVEGFEAPTFAEHPVRIVDTDVEFRQAGPDEVDALLAFWSGAAENDGRPADDAGLVRRLLERDPAAVIVAQDEGVIVGTVVGGWDGWRAHLYRLAVHPDRRGQGIARRLLRHGEDRAAALGATRALAMVLDANEAGAAVWRAAGYAPQGEWTRWVKPLPRP